jgi:hypothetical protein
VGGVVPETAAFGVHRPGGAAADAAHSGLAEPPGGAGAGVPRGRPKRSSIGVAAAGGAVAAAGAAAGGARMVGPGGVEARVEPAGSAKQARKQGRIKLNLSYVAPLSVMKIAFLVAVALGIAFAVVVFILWEALDEKAVFTTIDDMITEVVGANRPEWLNILDYLERGRIMSGAAVIAVINVVIITVVSTLLAVIYNIVAALVGGVHVTLKED